VISVPKVRTVRKVPKGLVPVLVPIVLSIACGQTPAEPATNRSPVESTPQDSGKLRGPIDVLEMATEAGKKVRFEGTSSGSYGPRSTRILVAEADGLEPRVASCEGVSVANFHRDAPLGHHFRPELADLKEAFTRLEDIAREVSYWPRCPMTWDVQDAQGANYRYCARKKGETTEPPRPAPCQR
jgi:hypothetical protein